jgi:hypothetical protein
MCCDCGEKDPVGLRSCEGEGCANRGCEACDLVDWCEKPGGQLEGNWLCDECHKTVVESTLQVEE